MVSHNKHNQSADSDIRGRKVTSEEVAYRDGYVQGRTHEDRLYREDLRLRREQQQALSNSNTTAGVFFGVILFILAALIGGTVLTLSRSGNETPEPLQNPESLDQPEAPQSETTIIERTREVIPAPSEVETPDIQINLPNPDLSEPAPNTPGEAAQPEAAQPETTQPETDASTVPRGEQ